MKLFQYLIYSLRIRRVEYRVAELPIFLIPVLMTAHGPEVFRSAEFWEGGCIFFLLFAFGDLLNCLADRELDAIYKPQLTEAVHGIGIRGVIMQAVLSATAAIALTVHLAWRLDRWILVPGVLIGLCLAYAYSVEPLRLKRRGLWQFAFYWFGLFTGPMIFVALLFSPLPAWPVWAISLAFGLVQTGIILVNTAEDFTEDQQMSVRTVIVALGLKRGIQLATVVTIVGSTVAIAALATLYDGRGILAAEWPWLLPVTLAAAFDSISIARLNHTISRSDHATAVESVRKSAKLVPYWMTSTAIGCLIAVAAMFYHQAIGRQFP
jgi:4-hydroxybenzoate polyprenyltransferase